MVRLGVQVVQGIWENLPNLSQLSLYLAKQKSVLVRSTMQHPEDVLSTDNKNEMKAVDSRNDFWIAFPARYARLTVLSMEVQ